MVVAIKDLVAAGQTAAQGETVHRALADALAANDRIEVSFAGVPIVSSSFVNAAFVELLGSMTFHQITQRIRITNSSAQVNDLIKRRLKSEAMTAVK
jgi:STAS-like domain of unknown function (DUF4325)